MKIARNPFESRQYMIRSDFELSHFREVIPSAVDVHVHDFYEIYYLNSGANISYQVGQQTYILRPGDIVIINSGDPHRPILNKNSLYDRILLWLSEQYVRDLGTVRTELSSCFKTALDDGKNLLRLKQDAAGAFTQALGKLEKTYNSNGYGDDVYIKCFLAELLVLINRSYMDIPDEEIEGEVTTNKLVDGVLRFIDSNLDKDLRWICCRSIFLSVNTT